MLHAICISAAGERVVARWPLVFLFFFNYTPPHNSGGLLWVSHWTSVCLSVRPSYVRPSVRFSFPDDILSKHKWIFIKLGICTLILGRSGLGLLMGKFCQIFTELSARDTPIFSFPDDNLSKYQGILTKLAICIDVKEIWFGIANEQISSNFYGVICPRHAHILVSGR